MFVKSYPETWRIDDWDQPWLPAPIRLLNKIPDSLACKWFPLTEESLFSAARKNTGLQDFGDEDFLHPFRLLLKDISQPNGLTALGRLTAQTILQDQLASRLCVENKAKKQPHISAEKITAPIIIAGLPRTGTTHLHNLLAEVDSLRFIPLWQTLMPTQSNEQTHDWRRQRTDFNMAMIYYILPLFRRMHEMVTDMPHEELTLCAMCYRSFFFEGCFRAPTYREWYANHEHTTGYLYLKKILQIFQSEGLPAAQLQSGKAADSRWVLKSPQHVDQLPAILNAFPDARIVLTHRDPARAVLSMVTMMMYTRRQMYAPGNRVAEAKAWVDRLETMLRDSRQQAKSLPATQVMHVNFDAFMQEPARTIEQVLDFANVELNDVSRKAITAHLQSHTRDMHGRIDYRFEDLGLNEAEIRERFSFYS